jgi:uncharacterized protein (DUF427 family)
MNWNIISPAGLYYAGYGPASRQQFILMIKYFSEDLRGGLRPPWEFAMTGRPHNIVLPGPGQESAWDYPRPPAIKPDGRLVTVTLAGEEIARSSRTIRILETSHAPTFYIPPGDVRVLRRLGNTGSGRPFQGRAGNDVLVRGTGSQPWARDLMKKTWESEHESPEIAYWDTDIGRMDHGNARRPS